LVIEGEILVFSTTDRNQLSANASLASSMISLQFLVRLRLLLSHPLALARPALLARVRPSSAVMFAAFFRPNGAFFLATRRIFQCSG
jgi:hypothetical protein